MDDETETVEVYLDGRRVAHGARDASVKSEPLTYRQDVRASYFRDLALAGRDDVDARERLQRHRAEMDVEIPKREERARRAAERSGYELRVNPNPTPGQGGYFAPPLWLIDRFAGSPRPRRVLADLMPQVPLPQGVQSVNLPRLTTGTAVKVTVPGAAAGEQDIVDAAVTSSVATISGQVDVPLQALEQSPAGPHLDWALFKDLSEDYGANVETQIYIGPGGDRQIIGIFALPTGAGGVNAVAYTDASPTAPEEFPLVGQAAAQIGDKRLAPPECWLMRTARWAWLCVGPDTATMPFLGPGVAPGNATPPQTPVNKPNASGVLLGWPVFPADAIPATRGTGTNEDAIVACRPSDMLLLESDLRSRVTYEAPSGTLSARLQVHAYVAAFVGRYPTGISTVTGTGMAVQAGY